MPSRKEYSRKRRTVVENAAEAVFEEKKIEEQEVVFLMDRFGYAKTVDPSVYERNKEAADSENRYIVHCMNTGKTVHFYGYGKNASGHVSWICPSENSGIRDSGGQCEQLFQQRGTDCDGLRRRADAVFTSAVCHSQGNDQKGLTEKNFRCQSGQLRQQNCRRKIPLCLCR